MIGSGSGMTPSSSWSLSLSVDNLLSGSGLWSSCLQNKKPGYSVGGCLSSLCGQGCRAQVVHSVAFGSREKSRQDLVAKR